MANVSIDYPANLWASQTSGNNAAQTLTIPAPGAGLSILIRNLILRRVAIAAVAGAGTMTYTSTNLGGFSVLTANLIAAGQFLDDYNQANVALLATAANTAVTISVPAGGVGVFTFIAAMYYTIGNNVQSFT